MEKSTTDTKTATSTKEETITFFIKNDATQQIELTIRPGMTTLGDAQRVIENEWKVPPYLQRIVCATRDYKNHPQDLPITEVLRGTENDEERSIRLHWFRDDDYCEVTNQFEFLPSADFNPTKRQRRADGEAFCAVTLRTYRKIARNVMVQYREFRDGLGEDFMGLYADSDDEDEQVMPRPHTAGQKRKAP